MNQGIYFLFGGRFGRCAVADGVNQVIYFLFGGRFGRCFGFYRLVEEVVEVLVGHVVVRSDCLSGLDLK